MSVSRKLEVEFELKYGRYHRAATVTVSVYVESAQGKEVAIALASEELRDLIKPNYEVTAVTAMEATS